MSAIQEHDSLICPACNGAGKLRATYIYKPQSRHDYGGENIERFERCFLCGGENNGRISKARFAEWEQAQECPACKGQGGKWFWSWLEDEHGTSKDFTFAPCNLCAGHRRVSAAQLESHRQQTKNLRFWGVGCTVVGVVGGIFIATQLLSAVVRGTPWLQCCPLPGFVTLVLMTLIILKDGLL
jgi:hypothetical protein